MGRATLSLSRLIALIAEIRRHVLPRLIVPLLSVLLGLIASLLVVGIRPLLVVVVLKVRLLPVPRSIVVDEAKLFLAF